MFTYRRIGGLRFFTIGKLGVTTYWRTNNGSAGLLKGKHNRRVLDRRDVLADATCSNVQPVPALPLELDKATT